jgi:perosamine synthetase
MIQISEPSVGHEEWQAVGEPLQSGWLTQGAKVREFEEAFASHHGVDHAIAVTSCTTGLHLLLVAAGIGPGDEVIVPAFTWVATANAVKYVGATVVFADVDPSTNNLDLSKVTKLVTSRTRAVIAVHLFGLCVNIPLLRKILPPDIQIFEDAACAAGAKWDGKPAGSLGEAGVFSFHPRKIITTGEGGMITTNNPELAERMRQLRNHGAQISEEERHLGPKPYILPDFNLLGFNYRMTDIQAAIGVVQLRKLEEFLQFRQEWATYYNDNLSELSWLQTPLTPLEARHSWQSYVLRIVDPRMMIFRNEIMLDLYQKGISTRPGTHAVNLLSYYRTNHENSCSSLEGARVCAETTIAIPLHNRMSPENFETIVAALHAIETDKLI